MSDEGCGAFHGLFDSFEAARAVLPQNPEVDVHRMATTFAGVPTKKVLAHDYPMMWWLQRAFAARATRVLDIGGSVGVHYYTYRRYLQMPEALNWRIVDTRAIVSLGRQLAATQRASSLEFCEDLHRSTVEGGADVWVASGAIQYIEGARPSLLLRRCTRKPRHVLLNDLPLYDGQDYVTTQNFGDGSFSPMQVFNRETFIRDIEALGYELADEWPVNNCSLDLPGHPERSFTAFTGLYFSERAGTGQHGTGRGADGRFAQSPSA